MRPGAAPAGELATSRARTATTKLPPVRVSAARSPCPRTLSPVPAPAPTVRPGPKTRAATTTDAIPQPTRPNPPDASFEVQADAPSTSAATGPRHTTRSATIRSPRHRSVAEGEPQEKRGALLPR